MGEADPTPGSCLHSACDCPAEDGSDYCSDECRNAHRASAMNLCHCGHEDCGSTD